MNRSSSETCIRQPLSLPRVPSWLLLAGCTLLVGIVFLTDEHRWDRSGLKDYVESAEERADAAVSGNKLRRLAFLGMGVTGFGLLIVSGSLPALREPMGLCLLLAAGWTFGSLVWSEAFSFTLKRLMLLTLCASGVVGLASVLSLRQLAILMLCITGSYLILGIVAEILQANFRPWASGYRFAGTLHPNAQSTNCGAMVLSSLALWRDSRRQPATGSRGRWLNSTHVFALLFCCATLFLLLTKSRTAIAGVMLTVGLIQVSSQRMGSNLIVIGTGLLLGLMLLWGVTVSGIGQSVGSAASMGRSDSEGAFNGRLPIWEICVQRVGHQIPIGFGYDGFWTAERIESVSWELGWSISSAHCEYIEIALGLGIIGVLLYLLVQVCGIIWFWLRFHRLQLGGDAMIFGLLVLGMIQGFMETGYLHPSSLAPFVTLTGLTRLAYFTDHQTAWQGVV